MQNFQEISSFIWGVCDDVLRGLFKQHEYGDVILPFLVLRRLDCVLEPHKDAVHQLYEELTAKEVEPSPIIRKKTGLKFFNHSKFDLQRLKADSKGLKLNFATYLSSFSQNVRVILDNFQLDKPVAKLQKNNKLFLLISKFTEVDLHPDKVDNRMMGKIYEELLRKFSEMSNETSGDHYTPRDCVKLVVALLFAENTESLKGEGIIRSIFDPCCGTGGMLTMAKEWIKENINEEVRLNLFGQEMQPQTYAICQSDMLISGEDPNNIKLGSSLSEDQFGLKQFDYMLSNPPYGVSWKAEKEAVLEEAKDPLGRFTAGTPRTSDGALLFVLHMLAKMRDKGSRIGVVLNGSPLFTGDAGSGESNIRKYIIEQDYLECIVALPDQMFFNTGISTYIWILNNNKSEKRKGKVQLIDATSFYSPMKKSLGQKRKAVSDQQREEILRYYREMVENEQSKIYDNEFFGYTKVTIERPVVENGQAVRKRDGSLKADSKLRDYERIPLSQDIEAYFEAEVAPHLSDAWMDRSKDKLGYEINFSKYFYQYTPLRSLAEITQELWALEQESEGLFKAIMDETV
ncbi:N-6 DNA methylase [Saprospira grandis]|uniref:N-6 DNA methylase n=1 Tax=Saprospira grandis TaxID=1008 RepID=UPI0022DD49FC|nr:N-6 DNA methylase [Saprospira grandis]WBM74386.1 N-6 DNA methylase [Saprospira grandis]